MYIYIQSLILHLEVYPAFSLKYAESHRLKLYHHQYQVCKVSIEWASSIALAFDMQK